jgi:uncharacterized protein (TIGR02145 family)
MMRRAVEVLMPGDTHTPEPVRTLVVVLLVMSIGSPGTGLPHLSAQARITGGAPYSAKRMADAKQWTTRNLDVATTPSYCYDDVELNCRRYGRLYTADSALRVCQTLGDGWRLPTEADWRQLAQRYGGVSEGSKDRGRAAYRALMAGGSSGFDALLGGARSVDGQYARLEAHGFYWTASESDPESAWFYNFGRGGQALHRQRAGERQWAFSVRCVR